MLLRGFGQNIFGLARGCAINIQVYFCGICVLGEPPHSSRTDPPAFFADAMGVPVPPPAFCHAVMLQRYKINNPRTRV